MIWVPRKLWPESIFLAKAASSAALSSSRLKCVQTGSRKSAIAIT